MRSVKRRLPRLRRLHRRFRNGRMLSQRSLRIRVETVPARADPTTAENPSLATQVLATFGNPQKDDIKAQRNLEHVKASAEELVDGAAEAVKATKSPLEQVDLQELTKLPECKTFQGIANPFFSSSM
jgi:hypothetical protein